MTEVLHHAAPAAAARRVSGVAALFTPFTVKRLLLRNRIVMAPMTRKRSPGGVPGADVAAYYARRARGGVGLVITEGTAIDHPAAVDDEQVPRIYGETAPAGWRDVVSAVHAAGGRIVLQLWHVGAMRQPGDGPHRDASPISPSGLRRRGTTVGNPMSDSEIASVIAAYARSAALAVSLGFDGIELHAAHGYLIDQFFWAETNQRQDGYGGDIARRSRFAAEIVAACRRAVGDELPILLRFSQWKLQNYRARLAATPAELACFLAPLVDAGVDMFHCSTRDFRRPEFEGSDLNLAAWTRQLTGVPVITVGAIGQSCEFLPAARRVDATADASLTPLVGLLEEGRVDLAAVGRALLADPEWAVKIRDNRVADVRPFADDALQTLW